MESARIKVIANEKAIELKRTSDAQILPIPGSFSFRNLEILVETRPPRRVETGSRKSGSRQSGDGSAGR